MAKEKVLTEDNEIKPTTCCICTRAIKWGKKVQYDWVCKECKKLQAEPEVSPALMAQHKGLTLVQRGEHVLPCEICNKTVPGCTCMICPHCGWRHSRDADTPYCYNCEKPSDAFVTAEVAFKSGIVGRGEAEVDDDVFYHGDED